MKLTGKTRAELEACLAGKSRGELLDLIFSLVTFERLLTAREIAEASHVAKRDVIQEMRDGRFVDPIFGAGFFCRSSNSLRVSAGAANAWRRSFFVPAVALPPHKKEVLGIIAPDGSKHLVPTTAAGWETEFPSILESAEKERREAREIGVDAATPAQIAGLLAVGLEPADSEAK